MRNTLWIGKTAWLVFAAAMFVGCGKEDASKQAEVRSTAAVPVEIAQVVTGDISTKLTYTGSIKPWRELHVVPDIPGKVAHIYVEEGDRVEANQVLAELDTRTAQLYLEQAQAGLDVAQANFNSAAKDWERTQELHGKGTISPQQVEKAELAYEASKAQLGQARSGLKLARHQLEVSVMRAPFGGIITGKHMNEGEYINPGMGGMGVDGSSVVTLMDLSKVKILVQASENDMGKIHTGQEASIASEASPGKPFFGMVSKIHPAADPASRTFQVEIVVPNKAFSLKAGTDARVDLTIDKRQNVLVIPEISVLEQAGAFFLFVADGDVAGRREVKPGLRSESLIEIIEGVREGENVIVAGNYGLRDGAKVTW
ncbi:MAG: efflux RND transporter periplasmic adaptor subunit [Candidatus Latescibacterota bacterium]